MENFIVIAVVIMAAGYLIKRYWNNYIRAKNKIPGCDSCDCKNCGVANNGCSSSRN
ncbi:MAG: FeoB-associated Cys-rich membrane protein [Desulfomonilaceae bacterium]